MAKKIIDLQIPEKIKILGISASPRRAGNTSEMVKYCLKAAESIGYVETEYISLSDLHFHWCTDCKKCAGFNKPADDPMICYEDPEDKERFLKEKEATVDGVVLGFPIYKMHEPALLRMSQEHTYSGGSPFFNEPDPGAWGREARFKPYAIISQGGQMYAGQEQTYWGAWGVEASGFRVGSWPTADAPEPQAAFEGGMLSCVDGMSVYNKDAWTSKASRVNPPLTGIRNERTLRNLGRWLAVSAMLMKLGRQAFEKAGIKEPEEQYFSRYAGGKPKPGSIIDKLIKEGKVTYVPQEELRSRKEVRG
ncbi:MAG: flavodoxin family protein [Chloroflexi bacterium]|nr:flavodoxin family protein [Chloroflexota bacterium]